MRNQDREAAAKTAADHIRHALGIPDEGSPRTALVLGTGWGDVLKLEDARELDLKEIPGFSPLGSLKGHARRLAFGRLNDAPVLALRGRIHLNEAPCDPELCKMVRLQIEMLLQLGITNLILTCAAGSLGNHFMYGDVGILKGFVTLFAPEMPLWAGEFCSPEDTLDPGLRKIASDEAACLEGRSKEAGYAMVRGPFFEGRAFDKEVLERTRAALVGMSMLPEACIAALYPGTRVLGLAFITNDHVEAHSHETNLKRARKSGEELGTYLQKIVTRIHTPPAPTPPVRPAA